MKAWEVKAQGLTQTFQRLIFTSEAATVDTITELLEDRYHFDLLNDDTITIELIDVNLNDDWAFILSEDNWNFAARDKEKGWRDAFYEITGAN